MNQSILEALQFSYLLTKNPIHTSNAPRKVITYQFATTSQPDDLPTSSNFFGWTPLTSAEKAAIETQQPVLSIVPTSFCW